MILLGMHGDRIWMQMDKLHAKFNYVFYSKRFYCSRQNGINH